MSVQRRHTDGGPAWVPLSVRRSRLVAWAWFHTTPDSWLSYRRASTLARWLP